MSNFSKISTPDLHEDLKRRTREISKLTAENRIPANTPEDFVKSAERDQRLQELHRDRLALGAELLKREKEQLHQQQQALTSAKEESARLGAQLRDSLVPEFAQRLHTALAGLSEQFKEVMQASLRLQQLDTRFLNANSPGPVGGSLLLEPSALQSLIKRELTRVFGDGVARYQVDIACQIEDTITEEVELLQTRVRIEGKDHG